MVISASGFPLRISFRIRAVSYTHLDVYKRQVFISGDKNLCSHVHEYDPRITAVAVKEGMGAATVNLAPEMAQELIEEGAKNALLAKDTCHLEVPETIVMEINFKDHFRALRASYYPGMVMTDDFTVSYTCLLYTSRCV